MKLVAVKKHDGDIIQYKLDNGEIIDKNQAIEMVKNDQLDGYNVGKSKSGDQFIRTDPDGDESNNLDRLPEF